jgi:UDP:flavonoid glycosyltransferase YjiC (YdhE family)
MRVLFTSRQGFGHIHALIPLAGAARAAGHEVTFAVPRSMGSAVERCGFRWFAAGLDESSAAYARFIDERNRLPGRQRTRFMRRGSVTLLGPRMAADILGRCEIRRPDLIVRDASDYGGYIAGEVLGIPHAAHQAVSFEPSILALVAEPLDKLRAAYGLAPDPSLRQLERYLVLSPFPPSLNGTHEEACRTLYSYRAIPFDRSGDEDAPAWSWPAPDAPLVYATLGTAVNTRTDILRAFVEALRDQKVNLVLTVGRNGDPEQFGPQPPNVRIERYVPQSLIFPRCDLVISHGGSNTMLGALAHGIPQVMVPIAADQPDNAERCATAGAARIVPPTNATPAAIRSAALAVLSDPTYRQAARRVRDEMVRLPGLDRAVVLLERLAREKRPISASAEAALAVR